MHYQPALSSLKSPLGIFKKQDLISYIYKLLKPKSGWLTLHYFTLH
jgi:hypothetical protein